MSHSLARVKNWRQRVAVLHMCLETFSRVAHLFNTSLGYVATARRFTNSYSQSGDLVCRRRQSITKGQPRTSMVYLGCSADVSVHGGGGGHCLRV
jgi:hypothetical protein